MGSLLQFFFPFFCFLAVVGVRLLSRNYFMTNNINKSFVFDFDYKKKNVEKKRIFLCCFFHYDCEEREEKLWPPDGG